MARAASRDIVVLGSRRKAKLGAITRRASAPQALARRARIVLLAHAGWPNARIAAELGCAQGTVRTWRRRFARGGMPALSDPRKRAFTLAELQAFSGHAHAQVGRVRGGGRKGWLPVFRDAALFKVAYGFGLRRTETQMPGTAGFGTNPHAAEFGGYGLCRVRFGKAKKGSPSKRRTVLTVWPWVPDILIQWADEARPLMPAAGTSPALWPSERGNKVGASALNRRFAVYRDALGLEPGLDFHSLRRSYVTHLIEDGWDP